jgi:hypothetical protein
MINDSKSESSYILHLVLYSTNTARIREYGHRTRIGIGKDTLKIFTLLLVYVQPFHHSLRLRRYECDIAQGAFPL